jgi:hypothetical protein
MIGHPPGGDPSPDGSLGRLRVDAAPPGELGIHSAITADDADDDLPEYVRRDFDFRLRHALTANVPSRGSFVIMIGGSSSGKTRSLYEAVYESVPDWWLVQPVDVNELLEMRARPPSRTVFWLDELQQYLGGSPPLSRECIRALTWHGNIVVGTLWPDQYAHWTSGRDSLVKDAIPISVPDELSPAERRKAAKAARVDSRIRRALDTRDTGLTQALAGGPELVLCWEQPATPYVRAIITAAADAHRLGVQSPLSKELLGAAMFGYLRPRDRVTTEDIWLAEALPHVTRPRHGDVSVLSPVDNGRAGTFAGYTIADYLAQHLRRERRADQIPHEAWEALVTRLSRPSDLRRVADGATARMRYRYAEMALDRLVREFGDGLAASELADLLARQDRFEDALDALRHRLSVAPRDDRAGKQHSRIQEVWQWAEQIRPRAGAGDPEARDLLREIFADGGLSYGLRLRAERGDVSAEERLVERLADQGCLREIRERADRGEQFAAEALADLYVAWGDVELLAARAEAGDRAAELRLSKVNAAAADGRGPDAQLAELRTALDAGAPEAAGQLCALLFELRDRDELWHEMQAGTSGAADRLLALYTATDFMTPEQLTRIRAFGLEADGQLAGPDDFMTLR